MFKTHVDLSQFAPGAFTATTASGDQYAVTCYGYHAGHVVFHSTDPNACAAHEARTDGRRVAHGIYALNDEKRVVGTLAHGQPLWLEPYGNVGYATNRVIHVVSDGRTLMGCTRGTAERCFTIACLLLFAALVTFIIGAGQISKHPGEAALLLAATLGFFLQGRHMFKQYKWIWFGF